MVIAKVIFPLRDLEFLKFREYKKYQGMKVHKKWRKPAQHSSVFFSIRVAKPYQDANDHIIYVQTSIPACTYDDVRAL